MKKRLQGKYGGGCRSPLGLRGLKCDTLNLVSKVQDSRSPLGLRGLKYLSSCQFGVLPGRSPLGLRGLKFDVFFVQPKQISRSPLGLRGLKSMFIYIIINL